MEVSVELFLLRMRKKRSSALLPLDDFDGAKSDLRKVAATALAPLVAGNYKGIVGKSLSCEIKTDQTGFSGTITSGAFGFATKVLDVLDGSTAFTKKKTHADQTPFYIKLFIPDGGATGILALQRFGKSGVNDAVRRLLREHIEANYDKVILDVRPLAPDFVMSRYLTKGRAKAVTFIKNSIPADLAEGVSPTAGAKDRPGKVEVRISSSDQAFFGLERLAKLNATQAKVSDAYSFDQFEPDRVKLEVEVGGRPRIVNLNNHANLRCTFDISDDVKDGDDGYPTNSSVAKATLDIIKMLAPTVGVAL